MELLEKPEIISSRFSLALRRHQIKEKIKKYLKKRLKRNAGRELLIGLTLGDFEKRSSLFHFQRLGLLHLLAISGFHFSLIANFLKAIISPFLKAQHACILIFFLLSLYFLYMGDSPSVFRAWLGLSIFLGGKYLGRNSSSIQSLSLSFSFLLLQRATLIDHLGFQFSFLCTLSLLIFTKPLYRFLYKKEQGKCRDLLCQSLSLSFSAQSASCLLSLWHFGHFPLVSFLSNLLITPFLSLSLFFLFLSASCFFFPPAHSLFLTIAHFLCQTTAQIAENFPIAWDLSLSL